MFGNYPRFLARRRHMTVAWEPERNLDEFLYGCPGFVQVGPLSS
jgi:hypothetical protein